MPVSRLPEAGGRQSKCKAMPPACPMDSAKDARPTFTTFKSCSKNRLIMFSPVIGAPGHLSSNNRCRQARGQRIAFSQNHTSLAQQRLLDRELLGIALCAADRAHKDQLSAQ